MKEIDYDILFSNSNIAYLIINYANKLIAVNNKFKLIFSKCKFNDDFNIKDLNLNNSFLEIENVFELLNCFKQTKEKFSSIRVEYEFGDANKKEGLLNFEVLKLTSSNVIVISIVEISDMRKCNLTNESKITPNSNRLVDIIGHHESMQTLFSTIKFAADSMATVLISGESGTGKERVADAIHILSDRNKNPFIKVNCSALSEFLLESELFGHVKGAFTGAIKDKIGKFEAAQNGTIFLDEISEISPLIQLKLLRAIQEKTIEKVGDNKSVKVNVRIITATNKNLRALVLEGKFREDLFYRLNVFPIQIVPLRERKTDIPFLCNYFIEKFNHQTGKRINGFTESAYRILMDYCWPGNIRELENSIEHAFVLCNDGLIDVFDLPQDIRLVNLRDGLCKGISITNKPAYFYKDEVAEVDDINIKKRGFSVSEEKEKILIVLNKTKWNRNESAKLLGISRVALWKKMKKFEIK